MRKTTEIEKKKLAMVMAVRRVDVARLISTRGVYVGVNVRSDEEFSGAAAPSALSSLLTSFSRLRAARDLKVGSAISRIGTEASCRASVKWQEQLATTRRRLQDGGKRGQSAVYVRKFNSVASY
jgi:hypothetical protein